MKCVLHIGTEKTGTSLLQDWFYAYREDLKENGIHITTSFGKPNNRHVPAYFRSEPDDFTRAYGITSAKEKQEFFTSFKEDFETEMAAAEGCTHFIISSEHFHSRLTEPSEIVALQAFLSEYFDETFVVCYFREQSDMALSFYSTQLKGGGIQELNAFMDTVRPQHYYYNHLKIADNWSNAFGVEQCRFRIYERERFASRDIRRDFMLAIDMDVTKMEPIFSEQSSNELLSALQAAVFLKINQMLPYWDDKNGGVNKINVHLKKTLLKNDRLNVGRISHDQQLEVSKRFEDVNRVFLKKYCDGDAPFETRLKASIKDTTIAAEDVEATVSDVLGVLLKEYEYIEKLKLDIEKLKLDIEELEMDISARRSSLAAWIDKCDYKIHCLVARAWFLPEKTRARFEGAARRRKRSIYTD